MRETRDVIQLKGIGKPQALSLHLNQPDLSAKIGDFEEAIFSFYADGRFSYSPSKLNTSHDLRCMVGEYKKVGDVFLFHAAQFKFADHSMDGFVVPVGDQYRLQCILIQDETILTCTYFEQTLAPDDKVSETATAQEIEGIPVPSSYQIDLTGTVDDLGFGPLTARLDIRENLSYGLIPATDDRPFSLSIQSDSQDPGGLKLSLSNYAAFNEGIEIEYELKSAKARFLIKSPYRLSVIPAVSWYTVVRSIVDQSIMTIDVESEKCELFFELAGDKVEGKIRGTRSGPYMQFQGDSNYEAAFTGNRMTDAPSSYKEIVEILSRYPAKAWQEGAFFTGEWAAPDFGQIRLIQDGPQINGNFAGNLNGTLSGTARDNRAELTWQASTGEQGNIVLQAVRGGQILAGLQWRDTASGEFKCNAVLARSERATSDLPAKAITSFPSLLDIGRLASNLGRVGRADEASQLYEKLLVIYPERSAQEDSSTLAWAALKFEEATALRESLSCLYQMACDGIGIGNLYKRGIDVMTRLIDLEEQRRKSDKNYDYLQISFVSQMQNLIDLWIQLAESDQERIDLLEQAQPLYQRLIEFFADAGEDEEALIWSENARARATASLLAGKHTQMQFSLEMHKATGNFPELPEAGPPPLVTRDMIAYAAEKSRSAIIEYYLTDKEIFIWVISPEKVKLRRKNLREGTASSATLPDRILSLRQSLGITDSGSIKTTDRNFTLADSTSYADPIKTSLDQLSELLIEPIADLLPTGEHAQVTFVLYDYLFLVPFAALKIAGRYLIERYTISVSPSISVLNATYSNLVSQGPRPKEVLVIGDPENTALKQGAYKSGPSLPSLKYAREEAQAIAQLFETEPWLGKRATKEELMPRFSQQRLIHFATHGLLRFRQGQSISGAIVLASSEPSEGILSASEIAEMNIYAELVTLSACHTAQGEITGDGIIGLTRAFFAAGTRCLVASLWAVEDHSTKELMVRFYNFMAEYSDKAQALRAAMMDLMQTTEFSNPLYWAGFIITGNSSGSINPKARLNRLN